MHYGSIKDCDIANGPGVRVSLFVSGCTNHCEGCFQPQTWDFNYGSEYSSETEDYLIELVSKDYIRGISVLGGDPMEPENQKGLINLLKRIRKELPDKDIWVYTGYTYEMLKDRYPRCTVTDDLLSCIDVLVDGRFILAQKDLRLRFRGSRNQRLIDMNETRRTGEIVLWS